MENALIVLKTGSNAPFALAVEAAHRLSRERLFLIDFPGIDNPAWAVTRQHSLGRVLVMYADEGFCNEVAEAIKRQERHDVATMVVETGALVGEALAEDKRGRKVFRRPLRRIGRRYAEKAAQQLAEHLARKGVKLTEPIVPRSPRIIEENGKTHVVLCKDGATTPHYLVLTSGKGHRFTNAILREPIPEEVFFPSGNRDSYGFGGTVPNMDERAIVSAIVGGKVR